MKKRPDKVARSRPSLRDYHIVRPQMNDDISVSPHARYSGRNPSGALSPDFPEVQAPSIFTRLKKSDMKNHAHRFMQAFEERIGLLYKTENIFCDFEGIENSIARERVQLKAFDQKMVQLLKDLDDDVPSFTEAERQKCLHPNARMSKRNRLGNSRLSATDIVGRQGKYSIGTRVKKKKKKKKKKMKKKKKKNAIEWRHGEGQKPANLKIGRSNPPRSMLSTGKDITHVRMLDSYSPTRRRTMADHFRHTKNRLSRIMSEEATIREAIAGSISPERLSQTVKIMEVKQPIVVRHEALQTSASLPQLA